MSILAIAGAGLRRVLRDRTGLFFLVLLPIVVILVVGATVGGEATLRMGVVVTGGTPGPVARALAADLRASPGVRTASYPTDADGRTALRRGEVAALVEVPAGLDAAVRSGGSAAVPVLTTGAAESAQTALTIISGVVARHAASVQAAAFATRYGGGTFDQQLARAGAVQSSLHPLVVRTTVVNSHSNTLPAGFSYSAPTMLVLFVFINALAGGSAMIETRRLGIHARALAAPVRPRDIVLGEALTYLTIALLQSVLIVGVGAALFGVSWGSPVAAAALIVLWALVGTGAGMLSGTLFRTPEQASAIGPAVGIACGMLGGCMWPLEIVPPAVRTFGHATPHAWAVDAWTTILSRGGGIADIAGQLAVLAGFAAVLLVLASLRLRRTLTV